MRERERGPRDIEVGERLATLAAAMTDGTKLKARGEHESTAGPKPPRWLPDS